MRNIIERMTVMLKFGHYDVFQICEAVDIPLSGGDFSSQWSSFCDSICADKSDKMLFEEVGSILGCSDADSQIEQLSFIKNELKMSHDKKRDELEKRKRLYFSLGGFGGLMLCILIV